MSRPPGTVVTTITAPPARGVPTDTGVLFCTGRTERGPVGTAVTLKGMNDYATHFGDRVSYGALYDALDVAFKEGLHQAIVSRVVGPAAASAAHTFVDRAGSPVATVRFNAAYVGDDGNNLTVAIANGVTSGTVIVTVKYAGTVVDTSPELASPAAIAAWQSAWVVATDLASATAAPNNNPAVITDTALSGGTADATSITDAHWTNALNAFPANLGPGQVAAPGRTTDTAHQALTAHAAAFNRFALLDMPDTATLSTIETSAKNGVLSLDGSYAAAFAPWVTVPGVVAGTTRTVPPSALLAGLIATDDALGDADTAPMGPRYGASSYALGVTQTFTPSDEGTLNDASVNVVINPFGTVMNYGLRSLDTSGNWTQFTNSRLRMQIAALAGAIGDNYVGSKINDATIQAFQGDLKAMLSELYDTGALYGATAADAFRVDVGPTVNTDLTAAAGHLKAVLSVRMTESAEYVDIEVIKVPLTQAV